MLTVMDRDRRLTGYLRGQIDQPTAPAGFEVSNGWRVSYASLPSTPQDVKRRNTNELFPGREARLVNYIHIHSETDDSTLREGSFLLVTIGMTQKHLQIRVPVVCEALHVNTMEDAVAFSCSQVCASMSPRAICYYRQLSAMGRSK
jgi:hypothetical protein